MIESPTQTGKISEEKAKTHTTYNQINNDTILELQDALCTFWMKFFKSYSRSFLKFQSGIKKYVLSPDDGDLFIDLLVFLNSEIASNLQSKHPNFNSVYKNIFLAEFQSHLMTSLSE